MQMRFAADEHLIRMLLVIARVKTRLVIHSDYVHILGEFGEWSVAFACTVAYWMKCGGDRTSWVRLMNELRHALIKERAFAHVHVRRHLIADAPNHHAGMIAVALHERFQIILPTGAIGKKAVPFVEGFVPHDQAEAIA